MEVQPGLPDVQQDRWTFLEIELIPFIHSCTQLEFLVSPRLVFSLLI